MDDHLPSLEPAQTVLAERSLLCIESRPELIAPLVDLLKQKARLSGACHDSRAGKLVLALHEALTNAIVHGNLEVSSELKEREDDAFARTLAERAGDPTLSARRVRIEVEVDPDRCTWSFADEGRGFDHRRYLEREPDPETMLLSSGRGILLMRAFVDEVRFDDDGRKVSLTLNRSSGQEKRRQDRLPMHQRVQVAPIRTDGSVDWQAAYDAVAQNLSSSGMGLLQAGLATSDRVLIGMEHDGRTIYVPAQVRHCDTVGEGIVEIGCRFLLNREPMPSMLERPAVEEAIVSLLHRRRSVPRTVDERRNHPREAFTERIEIHDPSGKPTTFGFARDLSKGGIAFITTSPLPLEPRLIGVPRGDGSMLRLKARIVRCLELTPGFFDVGACFLSLETA